VTEAADVRTALIAAAAALGIGWLALSGRLAPSSVVPAAADVASEPALAGSERDELARLRAQSQRLEAEVARLGRAVEAQDGQGQGQGRVPAQGHGQPGATAAASPEAYAAAEQRYREHLDATLASEGADPAWPDAAALPGKLQAALAEGGKLESTLCGSSLCRALTSHRSIDGYNAFLAKAFEPFAAGNAWPGPGTFMVLDDANARAAGRVLAVMYLGRGKELPALPQQSAIEPAARN
jgi:hypothetical protein